MRLQKRVDERQGCRIEIIGKHVDDVMWHSDWATDKELRVPLTQTRSWLRSHIDSVKDMLEELHEQANYYS